MKKLRNKGFTLVELIAIIVVITAIFLVAVPIITKSSKDAQNRKFDLMVNILCDAAKSYVYSNPDDFDLDEAGAEAEIAISDLIEEGLVSSTTINPITNSLVTADTLLISAGEDLSLSCSYQASSSTYALGSLVQYDPVNNTSCTTGSTCYKWRVITVGDTASNSTITLQMDHNLINLSVWVSQADYNDDTNYGTNGNTNKGPITALKALETETSTWDNSLKLNYTYDTSLGGTNTGYNYGTLSCTNGACTVANNQITSNLKARMITGEEISAITVAAGAAEGTIAYNWTIASDLLYYFSNTGYNLGTQTSGTGSTELSWLVENTYAYAASGATANAYGANNYGYWTLSASASSSYGAWYVYRGGSLSGNLVGYGSACGVRPVITISKSVLQ